jgi:hypothetical protein
MAKLKNNLLVINFHFRLEWPAVRWVSGQIHREIKQPGREADILVTRLRMRGTIFSFPHTYLWRDD